MIYSIGVIFASNRPVFGGMLVDHIGYIKADSLEELVSKLNLEPRGGGSGIRGITQYWMKGTNLMISFLELGEEITSSDQVLAKALKMRGPQEVYKK